MENAINYNSWIVEIFKRYIGRAVMDVGIGHGGFLELLRALAPLYVGVDIDPELVAKAKARNPEVTYIVADATSEALRERAAEFGVDTIFCCNVLEHLEDDALAVARLMSALPAGGHLLLYVPAFPALYNALDRLRGHYRRYTRKALAAIMPSRDGEIVVLQYVNPIGGVGWWMNGLMHHQSLNGVNGQIALFDKYILPLSRLLTPLSGRVFGQSLVCVVRRK
jgi:SAM-dependent methyltransferase